MSWSSTASRRVRSSDLVLSQQAHTVINFRYVPLSELYALKAG